jgi:thymidylate synthase
MKQYLDILGKILEEGEPKSTRTGIGAISIPGMIFEHDMSKGFPLLTTKQMAKKTMMVELEGFIKGITDKAWYQERGCHIWDEWCNPARVPYGHSEETKRMMAEEKDLGPIYGFQWRHFGAEYTNQHTNYSEKGVDQLAKLVDTIQKDPDNRRMIVSAWNPGVLNQMALPPCHYGFQVVVTNEKLNLMWNQRSVDTPLGLPFNIASYATLLHLLARHTGKKEGKIIGFLGDVHIYDNQIEIAKEQITREPMRLPRIETIGPTSIFEWNHTNTSFPGYQHHPKLDYPIAI